MCVSVAWDWVYKGVSQEGCRGEMACALRCASDNRRFGVVSLAPVETCLVQVRGILFFDSPLRFSSILHIIFFFFLFHTFDFVWPRGHHGCRTPDFSQATEYIYV